MEFLELTTQKTLSLKELKEANPSVSFPDDIANADLNSFGVALVTTEVMPPYDPKTETVEISEPVLVDGKWVRQWSIQPKPIESVTMRQARLVLLQQGLLDQVETALASLTGTEGKASQIEWEYAQTIERNTPLVTQITATLGLNEAQVDDLFRTAVSL